MPWREELHSFGGNDRVSFAQLRPAYDAFLASRPTASDFVELAEEAPVLVLRRDEKTLSHLPELQPVAKELVEARHRCLDALLTLDGVPDELLGAMLAVRNQMRDNPRTYDRLLEMNEALETIQSASAAERTSAIGAAIRELSPRNAFTTAREAHQHAPALVAANADFEEAVLQVMHDYRAPTLHMALSEHQEHEGVGLEKTFHTALLGLRKAAYTCSKTEYSFFEYAKWWVGMALIKERVAFAKVAEDSR